MDNKPLTPLLANLVKPIRATLASGDDLTKAIRGNARYAAAQLSIRSACFGISSGRVSLL